jgi:hypothetical protein
MKILVFVVVIFIPSVILPQTTEDSISCNSENSYFVVDSMPRFNGNGVSEFKGYVVRKLHQSPIAFKSKKRGEIAIHFVICQTGSLVEPKVVKGMKDEINNEVLSIMKNSPKWEPGWNEGNLVSVAFTERIPVNFKSIKK